ncbi:hypothetical protein HDU98_007791 [Podochytrium sp. JEL0797]|nr:hypothetical protein HDU98_007791 [Podochytrium sp. JEL0797]
MRTSSVISTLIAGLLIGSTTAQSNSNLVCQVMNTQGILVNAPCNSTSIVESVDAQLKNLLHMGLSADSIISMLKSKLCDHDLICFADLISKAKRDFLCERELADCFFKLEISQFFLRRVCYQQTRDDVFFGAAAPAATTVANWATCRLGVDSCQTGYACCVANADFAMGKATCRLSGPGISSSTVPVSSKPSSTTSVAPVVSSVSTKTTISTTSVSQSVSSPVVKPTTSTTTKPVSTSTSTTPAPAATISNWSACRNGVDTCSDKAFVCCEGKGDTGKTTCRSGAPGSDCKPNVIANYATCRANIDNCSGSGFVCCMAAEDVAAGKNTCRPREDSISSLISESSFNSAISTCLGISRPTLYNELTSGFSSPLPGGLKELALLVGNTAHESGSYHFVEEIKCKGVNTVTDNCPYGWYHGRGYIQLSWKSNYQSFADAIGNPEVVWNPDLVMNNPTVNWQSVQWYWTSTVQPRLQRDGYTLGNSVSAINGPVECPSEGGNGIADQRAQHIQCFEKQFVGYSNDAAYC